MSGTFFFGVNQFPGRTNDDFASWTVFSTGDNTPQADINDPAHFSAVGSDGSASSPLATDITFPDDRDIVTIALHAGQQVTFDIDYGVGASSSIDLAVFLVDANGRIVARNDDPPAGDPGSTQVSGIDRDPLLTFTAQTTGVYYLTVSQYTDSYIDGAFTFDDGGTATGDYQLNISTPTLAALTTGTTGTDNLVRFDLPDRVDLDSGDNSATLAGGNDIADGGSGNDTINGGNGDDILSGGFDNDTLIGAANRDVLVGQAGVDNLSGGTENDELFGGSQADTINGDAGDDLIVGEQGGDSLNGGTGIDTLSYGGSGVAVNVNLLTNTASGGDAAGDTIQQFENVIGSIVNDTLVGNNVANTLDGTAGGDTLVGNGGDDLLIGGFGGDSMDGGANIDTVSYANSRNGVTVNLATNTHAGGDAVGDFIQNVENVSGSRFNDALTGNALVNVLTGGDSSDTLDGSGGADTMIGGASSDIYFVDAADVIVELANGNIDLVRSSVGRVLEVNVENLILLGTANLNGTGNGEANTLTGNTGSNGLNGGIGADTMQGLAGNDQYTVDNAGDVVTENAGEGTDTVYQSISTSGALAAEVENVVLIGTGNISVVGNALANQMTGNAGNNVLFASGNDDTMRGGLGDDAYQVDSAGDLAIELAGQGHDRISAFVSYTLPNNVEDLAISTTGGLAATGNALANRITGTFSSETFDGKAGADTMIGGAGDDIYFVDNAGDVVTEASGEGFDSIGSSITRTLDANVENLGLLGAANINGTGNALSNSLTGNDAGNFLSGEGEADSIVGAGGNDTIRGGVGADQLYGGGGSDTADYRDKTGSVALSLTAGTVSLDGVAEDVIFDFENVFGGSGGDQIVGNSAANVLFGGVGADELNGALGSDVLNGEAGNDTFFVDSAADRVLETTGGGTDTVNAFASYALAAAQSVETLRTIDPGATTPINLTGNELVNVVIGNATANAINGGAGADLLRGLAANDTYTVDNAGDVVDEGVPGSNGADLVRSSVTFSLSDTVHARGVIEHLTLTGTAAINATGNATANTLTGNIAANTLNGAGGVDYMLGLGGNDTYVVDNVGDVVDEAAAGSGGIDTVQSSISIDLSDPARAKGFIDHVTLTGAAAVNVTGNGLGNTLIGNASTNMLIGRAGADILTGGAGNDFFRFDLAPAASNIDTVTDFDLDGAGTDSFDTIVLENAIFTLLTTTGDLSGVHFTRVVNNTDADNGRTITYVSSTGGLFYDTNGAAAGGATLFAVLDTGLALTAADFFVT